MKKFLISLFVCVVGFIGFGNCVEVGFNAGSTWNRAGSNFSISLGSNQLFCATRNNANITNCSINGITLDNLKVVCIYNDSSDDITVSSQCNGMTSSRTVDYWILNGNANLTSNCPTCDDPYTSYECQNEYNLIPVEDVDINYCVGNGLCPNECGSGTDLSGDLQYSNLYINSILHPSTQNIFVDIPDYITWDYTTTGDDFNIFVGSGYDQDYINSIIDINSYRPDSQDFTNIFVSGLTLVMPYIVIVLFIIFVWKLLKRIFK